MAPTPAALLESRPECLYSSAFEATVDPIAPVPRAILTHAHSDHAIEGLSEIWATPETLAIHRRRHPEWNGVGRELRYGEEVVRDGARLRLVPAGHILGSAQVWLSLEGY